MDVKKNMPLFFISNHEIAMCKINKYDKVTQIKLKIKVEIDYAFTLINISACHSQYLHFSFHQCISSSFVTYITHTPLAHQPYGARLKRNAITLR